MNRTGQPKIDLSSIDRILLIRIRRIGDVVMTTPAVSALKQAFPQSHISYIIGEPYLELVEGNQNLDELIVLPEKLGAIDFLRFIRRVRKNKYDVVIDFHGGPRAFLITLFSRARLKIGYTVKYKHFVYDIKVPRKPDKGYLHSVENHLNLVRALGINPDPIPPLNLPETTEAEKSRVSEFLQENNLSCSQIIVLHIGAGNRFRDWGVNNKSKLIRLLTQMPNIVIVLVGGEEDHREETALLASHPSAVFSAVGCLNMRETRELISHAALFIGPDSGPMHIAASTSTPIVAYFGPTLPATFAPWQAKSSLIEKDFECRPCKQVECIHEDFRCLQKITPEEVYRACQEYLR